VRRRLFLAVSLTLLIGGCATAINVQDATLQKPYGGFTMPVTDFFGGGATSDTVAVKFWPLWLVDKPLSFVGDTLTLPYTLWVQRNTWLPGSRPNAPPDRPWKMTSEGVPLSVRRE